MMAAVLVLQRPPYYGQEMIAALGRLGYRAQPTPLSNPQPGDVMVTWNRHAQRDGAVKAHEAAGGTVLVVENGYFGRNFGGTEWFALAKNQHNGAGEWPEGNAERWQSLGVELKPWRADGKEAVILASRCMGSEICREPRGWAQQMARRFKGRIRGHPGPQGVVPKVSLEDDLANAWAAITWGSTAGLKAIAMGVPVFHGFKHWIGAPAAAPIGGERFMGEREPMFHRVATAMWSLEEIASGKAFKCLLT